MKSAMIEDKPGLVKEMFLRGTRNVKEHSEVRMTK